MNSKIKELITTIIFSVFAISVIGLVLTVSYLSGEDYKTRDKCRNHCATNHSTIHYDVNRDEDNISCICLKIEKVYSLEMK